MNLELPHQLEPTRRMLEASLRLRPAEAVPAVPSGLLADLNRRFTSQRIVIEPEPRSAWVERLRNVMATPAFGLAAAAVMVFGLVSPFVNRDAAPGGAQAFRGGVANLSTSATIVLVSGPADLEHTLAHSGQFDGGRLITVGDLAAADAIPGPKVILDFESATIRSISDHGEMIHADTLPERIADLTLSVADALSRF